MSFFSFHVAWQFNSWIVRPKTFLTEVWNVLSSNHIFFKVTVRWPRHSDPKRKPPTAICSAHSELGFFQACRHQLGYSAFSQVWKNCCSQCISPRLMKAINNFTFPVHARVIMIMNYRNIRCIYHCRFSGYKYHIRQGWASKFHLGFSEIVWWLWSRNRVLTKTVYYSCFPHRRASHSGRSSFLPGREQAQIWHDSIWCDFLQWLSHSCLLSVFLAELSTPWRSIPPMVLLAYYTWDILGSV